MSVRNDNDPLISLEAIRDLNEIWDYIAIDSERAADNFIEAIVAKCR